MQIHLPIQPSVRRTTHISFGLAILLLSMLTSIGTVLAAGVKAGATTPPSRTAVVRAAFYFGDASPLNFWSSDLSGAPSAFRQMKEDGFNAVELAVPWGEFQERVNPASYNVTAFKSLGSLVSVAANLHLQVILRLSYGVDTDPLDQSPDRSETVFGDQTVYNSWLGYISRVRQTVARYNDVKIAQLSWEDFWNPVVDAQGSTSLAQRLRVATMTGYRSWLKHNYTLAHVSSLYGTTFHSWSTVPTPPYTQPSFKLVYQYDDWALVHRFFVPAAARFPGLNLEARVDIDPLYLGTRVVGSYSHADTFQLPGTSYIGMYFSPYLGDTASSRVESPSQALAALQSTLSSTRARAGNRRLFIFEYQIASNSPEVANNPALPPNQIPSFILASTPIFARFTQGYSLWTYRDYAQSPLFNPSFKLGLIGWSVSGSATPTNTTAGSSLSLGTGASIKQTFPTGYLVGNLGNTTTISLQAAALTSAPARVQVSVAGAPVQTVVARGGQQRYTVEVPTSAVTTGAGAQLSITTTAPVSITNVQVYDFTQLGDVYAADGTPEIAAPALRTLNQQLAGH